MLTRRLPMPRLLAVLAGFLTATLCQANDVTLAWDSSPAAIGYRLHSGTTSGVYTQITELGNTTSSLVSNLAVGQTYFFVVTAYGSMAPDTAPSNEVSYTPASTPTPSPTATPSPTPSASPAPSPTAPTNLQATAVSSYQINLSWSANSSNLTGFKIERSTSSGTGFAQIGMATATATNYSSTGLNASARYYYRIRAYNSGGNSPYSSTASATTMPSSSPTPTPQPTPTPTVSPTPTPSPTASGPAQMLSPVPGSVLGSSTVTFNWSAGNATKYLLLIGTSPNSWDLYNSGQINTQSATVNNLPTNGHTIYVTLASVIGRSWSLNSYTYTAGGAGPTPTPTPTSTPTPSPSPTPTPTPSPSPAPTPTPTPQPTPTPSPTPVPTPTPTPTASSSVQMVSPLPGSTFTSSTSTFTWTAGNASMYVLAVGSHPNGGDIYSSRPLLAQSVTVGNIPTDGRTIYVTLGYFANQSWSVNTYTYKAFK